MSLYIYTTVLLTLSCFMLLTIHERTEIDWMSRFISLLLGLPIYGRILGWW